MSHSLGHDVDLSHYNNQSESDLKQIYDRMMPDEYIMSQSLRNRNVRFYKCGRRELNPGRGLGRP